MEILMQSENLRLMVGLDLGLGLGSEKFGESEKNKIKQRKISSWDRSRRSKYITEIREHTPKSEDETDISSKIDGTPTAIK